MNILEVEQLIKEFTKDELKIDFLAKGNSNYNFLITFLEGSKFIFRTPRNDRKHFFKEALYNEYKILKFLEFKNINFVPKIIYYSKDNNFMIISYLNGKQIKRGDLNLDQLKDLTKKFALINNLKYKEYYDFCQINGFTISEIENYFDLFEKYTLKPIRFIKNNFLKETNELNYIFEKFKDYSHFNKNIFISINSFNHGDIRNNILFDENFANLIDWELANFRNSPILEISYLYFAKNIDKNVKLQMLRLYSKLRSLNPDDVEKSILLNESLYLFNSILWAQSNLIKLKKEKSSEVSKFKKMLVSRINDLKEFDKNKKSFLL